MDFASFFSNYGLIILLVVLLVFMFWSSRRRMAKQKLEQAEKARQMVPGAEVLMQGGLYGTILQYDAENLDRPVLVEIAPGVEIKVHSQALLRVVEPTQGFVNEDDFIEAEESENEYIAGVASGEITSLSDDHRRAEEAEESTHASDAGPDSGTTPDAGTKPQP
ncbi:preprotein translocase subunit YajC [uncultured Microbacterium sp.]|uniref:preprotein translocase subunit YajC n=1 Tax=uncultured Microbacterium sp. TaxID=191216 RepID=UPI0035CB4F54